MNELESRIAELDGAVVFLGAPDVGKTTLVERTARAVANHRPAAVVDGDVGQSEIGPPGMMDLAKAEADNPMARWKPRGQWYVGATSPFVDMAQVVVGLRRLLGRAAQRSLAPVLVDTCSFVPSPSGLALATAVVDVLRPDLVVAVQLEDEMERWLRGVGVPVVRLVSEPDVRTKPKGLRAARRAARLVSYFRDAPEHRLPLNDWALRNTRLGAGAPVSRAERDRAASALGRAVVHGERAGGSVAFWTRGAPRAEPQRFAADFQAQRMVTFDADVWEGRSLGFIAPDGMCLAMGVVEAVDWASMTATVRAPLYGISDAKALAMGRMRHQPDGESLPAISEQDA